MKRNKNNVWIILPVVFTLHSSLSTEVRVVMPQLGFMTAHIPHSTRTNGFYVNFDILKYNNFSGLILICEM